MAHVDRKNRKTTIFATVDHDVNCCIGLPWGDGWVSNCFIKCFSLPPNVGYRLRTLCGLRTIILCYSMILKISVFWLGMIRSHPLSIRSSSKIPWGSGPKQIMPPSFSHAMNYCRFARRSSCLELRGFAMFSVMVMRGYSNRLLSLPGRQLYYNTRLPQYRLPVIMVSPLSQLEDHHVSIIYVYRHYWL